MVEIGVEIDEEVEVAVRIDIKRTKIKVAGVREMISTTISSVT